MPILEIIAGDETVEIEITDYQLKVMEEHPDGVEGFVNESLLRACKRVLTEEEDDSEA